MSDGFPELTDAFLAGQDVLYQQFNDIDFYVEDQDQEYFYFNVLRKLFGDIKLEKIFPLNGKPNLKNAALSNLGDKRKIYLVDLDFDGILGLVENLPNLFYLERYSIENYLLTGSAIFEVARQKNPKAKNEDIEIIFDLAGSLEMVGKALCELACSFLVIQKYSLGIGYYGLCIARDFALNGAVYSYRGAHINSYFSTVETALKAVDGRKTLKAQFKQHRMNFKGLNNSLVNIPGKYLITFIKDRMQRCGLIYQMSDESFVYSLSKEFEPQQLDGLKSRILTYLAAEA